MSAQTCQSRPVWREVVSVVVRTDVELSLGRDVFDETQDLPQL